MSHPHDELKDATFDAAFWDQRYEARTHPWDGEPNDFLAKVAAGMPPGNALDAGCGEGGDAVWLASQGWRVTAADISQVALDRGKAHDQTGRVTWQQADLLTWTPPSGAFDLVTSHFMHFAPGDRHAMVERLSAAVKPGGTLLVVAHHPKDLEADIGRWPMRELFYTAEELIADLPDAASWQVLTAEAAPRPGRRHDGSEVTIHDTVLIARRKG